MRYKVRTGDTLMSISELVLGDRDRYEEILKLNTSRIPDPDVLIAGQEILVPAK